MLGKSDASSIHSAREPRLVILRLLFNFVPIARSMGLGYVGPYDHFHSRAYPQFGLPTDGGSIAKESETFTSDRIVVGGQGSRV